MRGLFLYFLKIEESVPYCDVAVSVLPELELPYYLHQPVTTLFCKYLKYSTWFYLSTMSSSWLMRVLAYSYL